MGIIVVYQPQRITEVQKVKASIVIMSHLSDVQEMLNCELNRAKKQDIQIKINFAKFVMMQCDGDLNQEINPDEMFEDYTKRFK
jgi:hypothetical protein